MTSSARQHYIERLRGIERALRSTDRRQVAHARRKLAYLRRGLTESGQVQAYQVIFEGIGEADPATSAPPEAEQEVWLLVGGLFATHPVTWPRHPTFTLGTSLGWLKKRQQSEAVDRRFNQLLARDRQSLPDHLRQAVRLLAAHDIQVHYGQLLDDLVVLLDSRNGEEKATKVRLKWARGYHLSALDQANSTKHHKPTVETTP